MSDHEDEKKKVRLAALDPINLKCPSEMASRAVKFAGQHGELQRRAVELHSNFAAQVANWQKTGLALASAVHRLTKSWNAVDWKPVFAFVENIREQGRKAALVEQSGWLPHHTTPFDLLEGDAVNTQSASIIVGKYYRDHWSEVEEKFQAQLAKYDIDDEAKETFNEALAAHRAGLFRTSPRLLFPEIERVASNEFFDGKRKPTITSKAGKPQKILITRLKEVREGASKLPAGDILVFEYGWQLFQKLERHLYEEVGDDPIVRAQFAADPVPNRHGALHGIISYNTAQTSLNAIIMTDFLFHVISRMKGRLKQANA